MEYKKICEVDVIPNINNSRIARFGIFYSLFDIKYNFGNFCPLLGFNVHTKLAVIFFRVLHLPFRPIHQG